MYKVILHNRGLALSLATLVLFTINTPVLSFGQDFGDLEEIIAIEREEKLDKESQLLKNPMKYFERKRKKLANKMLVLSNSLDSVFGGENPAPAKKNRTRIKITFGQYFEEYESPEEIFDLSVRIALPNTEEKLQFLLDSLNEELQEAKNSAARGLSKKGRAEDKSYAAGLRYTPFKNDFMDFNIDGGIRLVWPLQTFAKLRGIRRRPLPFRFHYRAQQEFSWFDREGWASDSRLAFERAFSRGKFLSFSNDLHWHERLDHGILSHTLSLFHPLSTKDYLTYWAGSVGEVSRGIFVTAYGAGISYRRPIYQNWVFIQLSPGGRWAREHNFEYRNTFEARLEAHINH